MLVVILITLTLWLWTHMVCQALSRLLCFLYMLLPCLFVSISLGGVSLCDYSAGAIVVVIRSLIVHGS